MKFNFVFRTIVPAFMALTPLHSFAVVSHVSCSSVSPSGFSGSAEIAFANPRGTYLEALTTTSMIPNFALLGGVRVSVSLAQQIASQRIRTVFHIVDAAGESRSLRTSLGYGDKAFALTVGNVRIICDPVELVGDAASAAAAWRPHETN